jgi:hypothetical protein
MHVNLILLHWALEARYDTAYDPLKSPVEAHVHKTTYGPLIGMGAMYVMLLMQANPLLGQVGGGWALEIQTFWAL